MVCMRCVSRCNVFFNNHSDADSVSTFFSSEFFKLMNEVENDDLVFTLETIVDKFGEEMAPYALGLCQNLVIVNPCIEKTCSEA